jgi:dUTP pyrophosphatase
MISTTLKLKKTHPNAQLPKAMRDGDTAFDISTPVEVTLPPLRTTLIHTGLEIVDCDAEERREDEFALEPRYPYTFYGDNNEHQHDLLTPTPSSIFMKVEGRGGLALKGIFPVGGIFDSNYRGQLGAIMVNLGPEPHTFKAGDRIAQVVFYKTISNTTNNEVIFEEDSDSTDHHLTTSRGKAGFGSSDKLQ